MIIMSEEYAYSNSNKGDKRFYGKYRGTVINNIDPESKGRIQALVPSVLGMVPCSWAMPCVPFAGKGTGFYFLPVGHFVCIKKV